MISNEKPSQLASISDMLGSIQGPMIQGLTIVFAGYILFRLERKARRKDVALLLQALLQKCRHIIDSSRRVELDVGHVSVGGLFVLRPAYEEFTRISDQLGILGDILVLRISNFFLSIHFQLIDLEWRFRSMGPTGVHIDSSTNFDQLNFDSIKYLVDSWSAYESMAEQLEEIAPEILRITGGIEKLFFINRDDWPSRKEELENRLEDHRKRQRNNRKKELPAAKKEKSGY